MAPKDFFSLGPNEVLEATESAGFRCTGYCQALNSYENRVYEVEVECPQKKNRYDDRKVAKFYRPARWTRDQILEEHHFLADLQKSEVPVVSALPFADGQTLHLNSKGIYFSLFPKIGGRMVDEYSPEKFAWMGRLLARMHSVALARPARHRLKLTPQTYGRENLDFLLENEWLPESLEDRYASLVEEICDRSDSLFELSPTQKIHGDCHHGNILWDASGPFFLDFDDCVIGPPIQDFWLLLPGRDEVAAEALRSLMSGYQQLRDFDPQWVRLIEPLRALRLIHYSAWIARRWEDPAFPGIFPQFGTEQYWSRCVQDLQEQLSLIVDGFNLLS